LTARIASIHGFGSSDPSDERIREQLESRGKAGWSGYATMRRMAAAARAGGDEAAAQEMDQAARVLLEDWYQNGDVVRETIASPALMDRVAERRQYARRYDPLRSTIGHDALRRRKIEPASESANLRKAHVDLCAEAGDPELSRVYEARVADDLSRAGIDTIHLIRNLDMVEFAFGFTRVSATPETVQKKRRMPVRLMGFPRLQGQKRPIYVIEQQNEALYIRLDANLVAEFLRQNGVLAAPPPPPKTIGAALIESYADFGPFLRDFGVRDDNSQVRGRDVASLTYLLLHTMAHHTMHGIARLSGLDLSSMSEAIFAADLAFVVHRRGMTEDLGNISSMWRDHNGAFLRYLVGRRELRCGSGTLCDHRGGACPACIMIPETSCVAGNQLLSRSALVGGRAPLWDVNDQPLVGYFQIANRLRTEAASP
jgi:hypothetical protein